LYNNLVIL